MFHRFFDKAVPSLYSKLEIGVLALEGNEPEKVLTVVNLNGLPPVFHHDRPERNLVIQQSGKYVPNLGSDLTREIFDYLRKEHAYGNKVTGKMLETRFAGLGYGWSATPSRLALALLFRGGAVEVSPIRGESTATIATPPAVLLSSTTPPSAPHLSRLGRRSASRCSPKLRRPTRRSPERTLTLRGDIAQAFKQVASQDREKLLPVVARLHALKVPGWKASKPTSIGWTEFLKWPRTTVSAPSPARARPSLMGANKLPRSNPSLPRKTSKR